MAKKVLGQAAPAATTDTDVYTVPAGKSTVISTVSICNSSTATALYRIAVRPAGAAIVTQHYVAFNASLPAYSSDYLTIGITLDATDVVTVYSSVIDVAFSIFGDEA